MAIALELSWGPFTRNCRKGTLDFSWPPCLRPEFPFIPSDGNPARGGRQTGSARMLNRGEVGHHRWILLLILGTGPAVLLGCDDPVESLPDDGPARTALTALYESNQPNWMSVDVTVRSGRGIDLLPVRPRWCPSSRRSVPLRPPSGLGAEARLRPVVWVRRGRFAKRAKGFHGRRTHPSLGMSGVSPAAAMVPQRRHRRNVA